MVRARWISLIVTVMLVLNMGIGCAVAEVDTSSQRQAVIVDLIKLVMDSEEYKYSYDEETLTFHLAFNADCSLGSVEVFVKAYTDGIGVNCYSPIYATEANRPLMAEFLTRANYGLKSGHFEMDFSDGEIRCRNYMRTKTGLPTVEDITFMLEVTVSLMETYGDGISKVALNGYDPATAITECESN